MKQMTISLACTWYIFLAAPVLAGEKDYQSLYDDPNTKSIYKRLSAQKLSLLRSHEKLVHDKLSARIKASENPNKGRASDNWTQEEKDNYAFVKQRIERELEKERQDNLRIYGGEKGYNKSVLNTERCIAKRKVSYYKKLSYKGLKDALANQLLPRRYSSRMIWRLSDEFDLYLPEIVRDCRLKTTPKEILDKYPNMKRMFVVPPLLEPISEPAIVN